VASREAEDDASGKGKKKKKEGFDYGEWRLKENKKV